METGQYVLWGFWHRVRQLFATIKGLNSAPAKPWGCIMHQGTNDSFLRILSRLPCSHFNHNLPMILSKGVFIFY